MIYVFLAEGFEEIEAMTPVDCLRRAGKTVQTVGVGGQVIKGAHGIPVTADITANQIELDAKLEMIVLPGGMPGTLNLGKSEIVTHAIEYCVSEKRWIAAICAAPTILGKMGLLKGRKVTCYPGMEADLKGASYTHRSVVADGKLITAKGPGAAMDFSLRLVEAVLSRDVAKTLAGKMVYSG